MKYNPEIHRRRSIRLQGYDYSRAGAFFVTICTRHRQCLFGEFADGGMRLNEAGNILVDEWRRTASIRDAIELDEWVVMPNHFHGIVVIADDRGTPRRTPATERFGQPVPGSIPTVVRSFKSAVTRRVNELRQTPGMKLWQRNYWEHIVRNESGLNRIREYIRNNPLQWELDRLHPGQPESCGGSRGPARRAPTAIREPFEGYEHDAPRPHHEAWMV